MTVAVAAVGEPAVAVAIVRAGQPAVGARPHLVDLAIERAAAQTCGERRGHYRAECSRRNLVRAERLGIADTPMPALDGGKGGVAPYTYREYYEDKIERGRGGSL